MLWQYDLNRVITVQRVNLCSHEPTTPCALSHSISFTYPWKLPKTPKGRTAPCCRLCLYYWQCRHLCGNRCMLLSSSITGSYKCFKCLGEVIPPCRTPHFNEYSSECTFSHFTVFLWLMYHNEKIFMPSGEIPIELQLVQNLWYDTMSKAFNKSGKHT